MKVVLQLLVFSAEAVHSSSQTRAFVAYHWLLLDGGRCNVLYLHLYALVRPVVSGFRLYHLCQLSA